MVEIVKTEVDMKNIKYLNINVSNSEVERDPDIVRLCSDVGILEYVKKDITSTEYNFSDYPDLPYQFDNMTGSMNL